MLNISIFNAQHRFFYFLSVFFVEKALEILSEVPL